MAPKPKWQIIQIEEGCILFAVIESRMGFARQLLPSNIKFLYLLWLTGIADICASTIAIMINCIKTDAGNQHFINLVKQLDADLSARNSQGVNEFHTQFNKTNAIKHVITAYDDELPVGCGAIKIYDEHTMEVKRMFVLPARQGKGIATIILKTLEAWAADLGFTKCILQTGVNQPEAIRLYQKNNYILIENFGQYAGDLHSVCFEKSLV